MNHEDKDLTHRGGLELILTPTISSEDIYGTVVSPHVETHTDTLTVRWLGKTETAVLVCKNGNVTSREGLVRGLGVWRLGNKAVWGYIVYHLNVKSFLLAKTTRPTRTIFFALIEVVRTNCHILH